MAGNVVPSAVSQGARLQELGAAHCIAPGAWADVPADGSISLDYYLYDGRTRPTASPTASRCSPCVPAN